LPRGLPASYIKKAKRELGKGASWHDIFKRAWELYKGSKVYKAVSGNPSSKKGSRKKSTKKRSVSRMAKKKRSYRRKTTIPMAAIGGSVAGVFIPPPGYGDSPFGYGMKGDFKNAFRTLMVNYTGYDPIWNTWKIEKAMGLWLAIAGIAAHKIASVLGINRTLARAKIPLFRI